jgi:hypothetical protein
MYIRKSHVKGRDYYAVAETYRDDLGRARQRMIVSLGTTPNIADAIAATQKSIASDTDFVVRIARALVEEWEEHDHDPLPLVARIAKKGLAGSERDLQILDRVVDEELEGEEDELANTSSPAEQNVPLPGWAASKLAQLRRRLRLNHRRLETLKGLRGKF